MTMLKADGYDDCIIGICERNGERFIVYDTEKIQTRLMDFDGMGFTEAVEYFDFNISGSHLENGPGYVDFMDIFDINEAVVEEGE